MFDYRFEFRPTKGNTKCKAMADIIIEDVLRVKGFAIFDGVNGMFVMPPKDRDPNDPKKSWAKIWWEDPRDEGAKASPIETEVYDAMLDAWAKHSGQTTRGKAAAANAEAGNPRRGGRSTAAGGQGSESRRW